jgi:biopolymer transport protein ExbB
MHRTAKITLLALTLCLAFVSMSLAETPEKSWETVTKTIEGRQQETRSTISHVRKNIASERRALKKRLSSLQEETRHFKTGAQRLERQLQELKNEEATLKRQLADKQDALRKLESTVRDNANLFLTGKSSLSGASLPAGWQQKLSKTGQEGHFPGPEEIRLLTGCLLSAIEDSGRVHRAEEPVFGPDGGEARATVLRLGGFQALYRMGDDLGFLVGDQTTDTLRAATYRPDGGEESAIRQIMQGKGSRLPVDVSGGAFLREPPRRQSFLHNILEGGFFIWPLLAIALVGAVLVIERAVCLFRVPVNGQQAVLKAGELQTGRGASPAERVVKAVLKGENPSAEAMENRLEEAILEQLPPLERSLQTIKILAAISPLLGLLGTVSGIIQTFRVITAHGNGDPKLLSAGISEALLTTEVGLLVAIPLLLGHHFLQRRVKNVLLDMEYAGMSLITSRVDKGSKA